jgi:hypothetical protein
MQLDLIDLEDGLAQLGHFKGAVLKDFLGSSQKTERKVRYNQKI